MAQERPSERVSALMRRFKSRDTRPELAVRRTLHARGLRFRVHAQVPGYSRRSIDIAFTRVRVAVFIDGCYWHSCPEHGKTPAANSEWWLAKLERNVARDRETDEALRAEGWTVLRFWEHEAPDEVASAIAEVVVQLKGS